MDKIDQITARVLSYWFSKTDFKKWFGGSSDKEIKQQFYKDLTYAEGIVRYAPSLWTHKNGRLGPRRLLSLIVILDQFSRNCYRGTCASYKNDTYTVNILLEYLEYLAVQKSHKSKQSHKSHKSNKSQVIPNLCKLEDSHLLFLLMPLQHTTNISYQRIGISLLSQILAYKYAFPELNIYKDHKDHKDHKDKSIDMLTKLQSDVMKYTGILVTALYHHIGHYIVLLRFGDFPKRYSVAYVTRKWGQEGVDHLNTDNQY